MEKEINRIKAVLAESYWKLSKKSSKRIEGLLVFKTSK